MKDIKKYIGSGIIEMYVLGLASDDEKKELEALSPHHPEIDREIEAVSSALQFYNKAAKQAPNPGVKAFLMATIDFTERLKNGEAPAQIPLLSGQSQVSDYAQWLERPDMVLDSDDDAYARIIGYAPEAITAIVWLRNEMPYEVHEREYERLLIVEGSCDVIMHDKTISLKVGDYFSVPLKTAHVIRITSEIPCKVILQRVAA